MEDIYKTTYKITKKAKKVKFIGERFIQRYLNKCFLIYKNKKYPLNKEFPLEKIKNQEIKLKIVGLNSISDLSYLFQGCKYLKSFDKLKYELNDEIDIINNQNNNNEITNSTNNNTNNNINNNTNTNTNNNTNKSKTSNNTNNSTNKDENSESSDNFKIINKQVVNQNN